MRVKICGITRVEDALFAEGAGADAVGVVMYSPTSHRSVPEARAREIFNSIGPFVTRSLSRTHIQTRISNASLRSVRTRSRSPTRLSFVPTGHPDVWVIGRGDKVPTDCSAVIVDESMGAGRHFDRAFAREVVKTSAVPVILTGGLTPENVGVAIREIRPYAVDVASGVETEPGIKDHTKIAAFIAAAREV